MSAARRPPSPVGSGLVRAFHLERPGRAIGLGAVMLTALVAACTVEPGHPALQSATLPEPVPAHRFAFQRAGDAGYKLSPDGRKLAWFGTHLWRTVLNVRDDGTGETRRYRVGAAPQWTPGSRFLFYFADGTGAENYHLYVIDTADPRGEPVDLTPWPGVRVGLQQIIAGEPASLLVHHNRRDRAVFDLYRIDLESRRQALVARNPGDATSAITSPDGGFKGWRRSVAAERRAKGPPKRLAERKAGLVKQPGETFRMLGTNAERTLVYALSDRGRERLALVAAHPTLGWERVLFEDPVADVSYVGMSRVTNAPLIADALPGYPRSAILDDALRKDLAGIIREQDGRAHAIEILSTDARERRLVVAVGSDVQRLTYMVDRDAGRHVRLAQLVPDDLARVLSPMRPVSIESRDGLTLHGYLTLPGGVEPRGLPMVLYVHGGPWRRTSWGDPFTSDEAGYAQFLANRGYAVLQIDYRGSTGYGRSFTNAGIGEFGGRMQDDLHDAVRWAVGRGIADPRHVAIMGWSYGGYAALMGMAQTPDAFACGVSLAGPTDLASMIESFPAYWALDLSRWHDFVGDPAVPEDRDAMREISPLNLAERIARPVLIIHGAHDVRVRVDQADRMVAALMKAGKPVEYLRIPDMGHNPGWWAHRLAVLRRTETFLQRCLGGRAGRSDWFDAVAWIWTNWSRWREGGAPPASAGPTKAETVE
ncbi:MAG: S9 family peptidase [Burkholderiales bacterium]|nr:S9 family peptidase [Burkholderiales bacterium]